MLVAALALLTVPPAYLVGDCPTCQAGIRLVAACGLDRLVRLPGWSHEPARYVAGQPSTSCRAQNVPICVACAASHDLGKAAQNGGTARFLSSQVHRAPSSDQRRPADGTSTSAECGPVSW